MGLFHFANCLLLTYAPYVIIYRSTDLLDESLFNSCLVSGVFFVVTQLIKTFILATFMMIPEDSNVFSWSQELPIILVGVLDYGGLYMMHGRLQRKGTRKPNHLRVLAVAIGWACAEALVHYLIPLWIGARDVEFSWDYIEMGVQSNINLILHLASSTVVWLGMRNDLDPMAFMVVIVSCFCQLILSSVGNYMKLNLQHASSTILAMRFSCAAVLLTVAWVNFRLYSRKTSRKQA